MKTLEDSTDFLLTNSGPHRKQSFSADQQLARVYADAVWKTLHLEAGTDDAWKIGSMVSLAAT